jgi:hypothetical protein
MKNSAPESLAQRKFDSARKRLATSLLNLENILNFAYPLCLEIPRQKKHISLIFHKNRLLSVGRNCFKTHPKAKEIGYAYEEMHSELDAYRKVPKNYRGLKLTLVNVRFNRFQQLRMSRPCELCTPWCREVFDTIYYTDDEGIKVME